ncbi:MAG: hypothetical protein ACXVBE_07995 [Bdellovibrionota bacterium]
MRNLASYIVAAICIIAVIYIASTSGIENKQPAKVQRPASQPTSANSNNV